MADSLLMDSTDQRDPNQRPEDYRPAHDGRLPVSELLFDRPGAASPFGDDLTFPLPVTALVYRHPHK
jgi:succinate dehydrogenase / fumarate reductase iron-sulfur subunit